MDNNIFILITQNQRTIVSITNHQIDVALNNTLYKANHTIYCDRFESNIEFQDTTYSFTFIPDNPEQYYIPHDAQVVIFSCNLEGNKQTIMKKGKVGNIRINGQKITIEVKSIISNLYKKITNQHSTSCCTTFGSEKCQLKSEQFIIANVKVQNILNNELKIAIELPQIPINIRNLQPDILKKIIENGYILNLQNDRIGKVTKYINNQLTIEYSINNYTIKNGDLINLQCMCNNSFEQCHKIFVNCQHFRGIPLLK